MNKDDKYIKKIILYVIISGGIFFILYASTFGWRIFSKQSISRMNDTKALEILLQSHVRMLSERIGNRSMFAYEKLEESATFITDQFKSYGYAVDHQGYDVHNKKAYNIIATHRGDTHTNEIVLVGAHYDTCFNPGADDNASGVAGLLALAKMISLHKTNRTIQFVAFVNEEPPFFKTKDMGSRVFAKKACNDGEDIKAVIILEMIGYYSHALHSQRYPPLLGLLYPNKANFICMVGNWHSRKLGKQVLTHFKEYTTFPIESYIGPGFVPGVDFSDHWSFWKEGYPAVMITDTAFYRYPHYHQASDTYEKLDYPSMAHVVSALSNVLIDLAQ